MQQASFRTYIVRALKRRDFAGTFANVTVAQDGLTLKGDERGFLHVPFARIARMRVGFTETRSGLIYETKIWLEDEDRPLTLHPDRDNLLGYAAAVRATATALNDAGRFGRVYRGLSTFEALLGPVLMAPVVLFALLGASVSADPPVWWHFLVIPLLPTAVFGLLVWRSVTRHWPRPVASFAELGLQLP